MHVACQVSSHILLCLCTEWLSLNWLYVFSVNHYIQIGAAVHTPCSLMVLDCLPHPFIVKIWKCVEFIHHSLYTVLHVCTQTVLPFMSDDDQVYSNFKWNDFFWLFWFAVLFYCCFTLLHFRLRLFIIYMIYLFYIWICVLIRDVNFNSKRWKTTYTFLKGKY